MTGLGAHDPSELMDDARLVNTLLGEGLPEDAEHHLHLAALSYHLDEIAERHLHEAQSIAPGHAAVLIGLYRFYFYKGRLSEALEIAEICLAKASRENNIPVNWRDVRPEDAAFGYYEAAWPRFFLFVLKGYAYLQMRLGDLEEGAAAVAKLLDLDPTDKIGARVLLDVLERVGKDDDDDE